jgi:predicted permease
MIKNYFKTAFRNVLRHKGHAAINVSGLAVGIAACILLFIVIQYELNYDKFQPNYKQIARIVTVDKYPDGDEYNPGVPYPMADALRAEFPQMMFGNLYASYGSQVTVLGNDASKVSADKKFIESTGIFFADPDFFKVFHFDWLSGSPELLAEPNQTVLTQKMAEKYFGNWQSAVGQFIKLDNIITLKVAGILKDVPAHTDLPLAVITSYVTIKHNDGYGYTTDWGSTSSNQQVYMLLPRNTSVTSMNSQLDAFAKRHNDGVRRERRSHFLQPLSDLHFDNRFGNLGDHVTTRSTLWTLSLIGVFIMIMACINFINLSTAQAVNRSKEIGIRKVLGSNRRNLFWQMMGETAIVVFVSLVIAAAIAQLCLPFIKHIDSIEEPLNVFTAQTLLFLLIIAVAVTVFSGLYPSLIVSGFNPMMALKNKITSASIGGISLRRGLVVTQFAISQVLIIGTIVAVSQMSFVQNADLGFNKNAVFVLSTNADSVARARQLSFKQGLLQIPGVQSASFSSDVPSSDNNWGTNFAFDHRPDEKFTLYLKWADEDYLKTFGLELLAGHNVPPGDTISQVLINETLVKKLGLKNPQEAIGHEIRLGSQRNPWKTIAGVVKDFKTNSLREEIRPTLIATRKNFYSVTSVKIRSNNLAATRDAITKAWDRTYPEYAANTYFMDESINNFYRQEEQLSLLYKIFAGIALFISCLGLYGLVSFMAVQRTKEIGIRKVLGASIGNIVYLFSKEFTLLILVAFLLAAPLAWYMMSNWLSNFAYRISMGVSVFGLAIVLSVFIAWITVGYKSVKAALANPVKSLRTE